MRSTRRLLIRTRHLLTRETVGRWRSSRQARRPAELSLDAVHRRLELVLAAMYGRAFRVEPLRERRRVSSILRFLSNRAPRHLRGHEVIPESDGSTLRLPSSMPAADGAERALARFRLLALEQAERVERGTAEALALATDDLERDLIALREAAVVDAALIERSPKLAVEVSDARARALAARPTMGGLTPMESAVESLVRAALRDEQGDIPLDGGAPASLAWARRTAQRLRASAEGEYRGIAPVEYWGRVVPRQSDSAATAEIRNEEPRRAPNPYANQDSFLWNIEAYGSGEGGGGPASRDGSRAPIADDRGTLVPMRSDVAGPAANEPDSLETPAGGGTTVDLDPLDEASREVDEHDPALTGVAAEYPEWNEGSETYKSRAVTVRECYAELGNAAWANRLLLEQAPLVRRIRERFEPLRARRLRQTAQRDGDELDLSACVRALVERRAGHSSDDRLYVAVRPARRGLAIALLVDISGSTEAQVTDVDQVIDVEKTALLLASEALDALGDRYLILTFASKGARDVRLSIIKDFAERNGEIVRRRIAAMHAEGNTRLGAAVRHATALLERQPAGRRLLLVLSDGKPNDIGEYQGDYAVADSRQAVAEARARGIFPFCLTIDREEPEYMSHIFGTAGYAIMRKPELLPAAVLSAVRGLLRS